MPFYCEITGAPSPNDGWCECLACSANRGSFTIKELVPPSFTIANLVTIRPDGTIEYGEGYTPDAAAKEFWDAIGLERKQRS